MEGRDEGGTRMIVMLACGAAYLRSLHFIFILIFIFIFIIISLHFLFIFIFQFQFQYY
jgi:hypothetical protein